MLQDLPPHDISGMPFAKGDRIRCKATHFDAAEDNNGDPFSVRHAALGHGIWVCGTIKHVCVRKGRQEQTYKALFDGDKTQSKTCHAHLQAAPDEPESDSSDSDNDDEDRDRSADHEDTDEESADDNAEPNILEGDPENVQVGEQVTAGELTWTRVTQMPVDPRKDVGDFDLQLKKLNINEETTEVELFRAMMPVSREWMPQVVKDRADECGDKHKGKWELEHIDAFLCCTFGAAQFRKGTNLWATGKKGMLPGPNFGLHLAKDRFDRTLRCLARGPLETDEKARTDPWAPVRDWLDGFNKARKTHCRPGSRLTPDETMFSWTGKVGVNGMPHLSFVPRKPEPLGAELKTVCDGSAGVMLHMEVCEGTTRMARKKYVGEEKASTACTLRMLEATGIKDVGEDGNSPQCRRHAVGDSWFAGVGTARALMKRLGIHFVGNVKTGHKDFPINAMRWTLSKMERGDSIVFKCDSEDLWAVGWSDVHFKTHVTNHGTSADGDAATKKRQRRDGRDYRIFVKRPRIVQTYQEEMGWVDRHNRFRQDMLQLNKSWTTKRWQTRIQTEALATSTVGAFLLARKFLPRWQNAEDSESIFFSFMRTIIPQLDPRDPSRLSTEPDMEEVRPCAQRRIGARHQLTGTNTGKKHTAQQRCYVCKIHKRWELDAEGNLRGGKKRATRTSCACDCHPEMFMCRQGGRYNCWEYHVANCPQPFSI